jgi:hypothetical protein
MCKRHAYRVDRPAPAAEGAYEGKTVRLDPNTVEPADDASPRAGRRKSRAGGFPWWILWMVWPLMAGLKGMASLAPGTLTGIVAGLILMRRA